MQMVAEELKGEFWDERFALMEIPGRGDGFAVLREANLQYTLASAFCDGGKFICSLMRGEPLRAVSTTEISSKQFGECMQLLSELPLDKGYLAAEDVLDGETFSILKRVNGQETRIALSNPRLLGQPNLTALADKLDALLDERSRSKDYFARLRFWTK